MDSNNVSFNDPLLARWSHLVREIHRRQCESHVDALRSLNYVSVCHDVAVRVHDYSRTDRMLAGYERRLTAIALFQGPIARNQNLNHRRRKPGCKLLDREIKLLQHRWRFRRPASNQLCFVKIGLCCFRIGNGLALTHYLLAKAWH